jgi:hypothetical protein
MKVWVARIWIEQYESIAVFTSEDMAEQFIWSIIRHNASDDELENLPNDLSDAAHEVDEDSDFTIEECEVFDRLLIWRKTMAKKRDNLSSRRLSSPAPSLENGGRPGASAYREAGDSGRPQGHIIGAGRAVQGQHAAPDRSA